MSEWSKEHAWRACNRQKRFMGSNPILSAISKSPPNGGFFILEQMRMLAFVFVMK